MPSIFPLIGPIQIEMDIFGLSAMWFSLVLHCTDLKMTKTTWTERCVGLNTCKTPFHSRVRKSQQQKKGSNYLANMHENNKTDTLWGLIAATDGVSGGLRFCRSGLNVRLAICMHSSSVFRNVAHVDFTRLPESSLAFTQNTFNRTFHKCTSM